MLIRAVTAVTLAFLLLASSAVPAQTSSATPEDLARAKAEIEQRKQDILLQEAELRVMELQMARQAATQKPAAKPVVTAKVSPPMPIAALIPPAPTPRRSNVDPAPYEASFVGRVSVFRVSQSSKWLVLDEKRVVYWVVNDEAYLLNLAQTCPGLLTAEKLKLENFSTKVRAGKDSVVVSGQRCLIESIIMLGGRKLPKPPKK